MTDHSDWQPYPNKIDDEIGPAPRHLSAKGRLYCQAQSMDVILFMSEFSEKYPSRFLSTNVQITIFIKSQETSVLKLKLNIRFVYLR